MSSQKEINLLSAEHNNNPYPDYAYLREKAPVYWTRNSQGQGFWIITGYDEVAAMFKDQRFVKDFRHAASPEQLARMRSQQERREYRIINQNMLSTDPPDHTRLRSLISKAFTPRRIEELRPRIEQIADELLNEMEGQEQVDLLNSYAFPLPIRVIAELLGIPTADRDKFRQWSNSLIDGSGPHDPETNRQQAAQAFMEYLFKLVAQKRANPSGDLTSALIDVEEQGQNLSEDELIAMIWLLIIAGHETTVNLIGNGVLVLLENPDQLAKLKQDPALIKPAIEEFLRYEGSVETSTMRYVSEDLEFAGQKMTKGQPVLLVIAGADHDPNRFSNPEELDITRTNNQHVAFGLGIHYCIGAPLARLEGQIAIPKLLERFPNLRLAVSRDQLQWRPSLLIRGLQRFPVNL